MAGRTKVAIMREKELDQNKVETGWIKIFRAVLPDCAVSKALFNIKKIAYEILPETIMWENPDGLIISNKERETSGGAISSKSRKEIDIMEKLTKVLEQLTDKGNKR